MESNDPGDEPGAVVERSCPIAYLATIVPVMSW